MRLTLIVVLALLCGCVSLRDEPTTTIPINWVAVQMVTTTTTETTTTTTTTSTSTSTSATETMTTTTTTTTTSDTTSSTLVHVSVRPSVIPEVAAVVVEEPKQLTISEWLKLMPDEFKYAALNMKSAVGGGAGPQYGASLSKADFLSLLRLKNTYNGQTVYPTYRPMEVHDFANNSVCFPDVSANGSRDAFMLNTSIWWSRDSGVMATIYRHKYPSLYNFSLYHNTIVLCWDETTNTTMDC